MPDSPETLSQIIHRIDDLEDRLCVLEHRPEAQTTLRPAELEPGDTAAIALPAWQARRSSAFSVLGIAMLGIAGAYLLRAVAESGTVPNAAAVALATAYAGGWLFAAARIHVADGFSRTIYACTSTLILTPMLWESTTRFHYLSAPAAAAILFGFALASYALAWAARLSSVIWVSTLTTAVTAIILTGVTHDLLAFASTMLAVALLNEIAAGFGRWSEARSVSAAAADILVCLTIFIYSRPPTSRPEYEDLSKGTLLAPALLLFLIYGVSGILRAGLRRHKMTVPEIAQLALSALLALEAVLHFATPGQTILFGVVFIALAVAGYVALFTHFASTVERRNSFVCASFSLALMLAGCTLSLDKSWLSSCLGALAMAAAVLATSKSRSLLRSHTLVYLIAAAVASDTLKYAVHTVAGAFPTPPPGIVWMILGTALFCYEAGTEWPCEDWMHRMLQLLSAGLAVGAVIAMAVSAIFWVTTFFTTPAESHIAVLRTFSICAVAMAAAYVGARFARVQLVWLGYSLLALLAVKLLAEDLRNARAEFVAISIFLYAVTLIAVPRLARRKRIDEGALASDTKQVAVPQVHHQ